MRSGEVNPHILTADGENFSLSSLWSNFKTRHLNGGADHICGAVGAE